RSNAQLNVLMGCLVPIKEGYVGGIHMSPVQAHCSPREAVASICSNPAVKQHTQAKGTQRLIPHESCIPAEPWETASHSAEGMELGCLVSPHTHNKNTNKRFIREPSFPLNTNLGPYKQ
ncbi:hypothetical protein KUCAC02_001485, partial [Chaenocephalus aceratus]